LDKEAHLFPHSSGTVSTSSPAEVGHIKHLAAQAGTTASSGLLAAFKTLLFRYTGQTDLIIGSILSHKLRSRRIMESWLCELNDEPRHSQYLGSSRRIRPEARRCLNLPFPAVLEMLAHQSERHEEACSKWPHLPGAGQ